MIKTSLFLRMKSVSLIISNNRDYWKRIHSIIIFLVRMKPKLVLENILILWNLFWMERRNSWWNGLLLAGLIKKVNGRLLFMIFSWNRVRWVNPLCSEGSIRYSIWTHKRKKWYMIKWSSNRHFWNSILINTSLEG